MATAIESPSAALERKPVAGWTKMTTVALLFGVVHAAVDCASGFLVFADVGHSGLFRPEILFLVALYNVVAFAGQAPAGALADRFKCYRGMSVAGVLLSATALLVAPTLLPEPWARVTLSGFTLPVGLLVGVTIVGVGNAFFHVGVGAHVLRTSKDRATESGVFVGPGAVGLAAGLMMGGAGVPARWFILIALCASVPLLLHLGRVTPRAAPEEKKAPPLPTVRSGAILAVLICATMLVGSVTVRALIGNSVAGTWRGVSAEVMLALAIAACVGKMVGGFIGDRVGWATLSVVALVLSAPLVSAFVTSPVLAVAGMLLFQMTMAVTLKATHHLMPNRPGLAFGIPCVALVAGSLPGLYGLKLLGPWWRDGIEATTSWTIVLATVAVSTVLVAVAITLLRKVGASAGPSPELFLRLKGR